MKRILVAVTLLAAPALADPPLSSEYTHTCRPIESTIHLGSRYVVTCDTAWKNPSTSAAASKFAIATTEESQVRDAMAVVHAAIEANKKVRVRFKTSGSPTGCDSECRTMVAVTVLNP